MNEYHLRIVNTNSKKSAPKTLKFVIRTGDRFRSPYGELEVVEAYGGYIFKNNSLKAIDINNVDVQDFKKPENVYSYLHVHDLRDYERIRK